MTRKIFITLLTLVVLAPSLIAPKAHAIGPPVLITEVQTGVIQADSTESPKLEFVELANNTPDTVDVTGWQVQYLSSASDGTGTPTAVLATLSGSIHGHGHVLLVHSGYSPAASIDVVFGETDNSSSGLLAKTAGHVRLMNGSAMQDCVAWGSATTISGCDKISAAAGPGYTLQRPDSNGVYDKSLGIFNTNPPSPEGGGLFAPVPVVPDPDPVVPTTPTCDNVILSEILPNPAGDDAQGEFIELYNPTVHIQSLLGCSLRLPSGKQYTFTADDSLLPLEYKALPYTTTSLQLTNSGGEVDLVTSTQTISTIYPNSADDQAWALIDGTWQSTKNPTPNFANSLPDSEITASSADPTKTATTTECAEGKYRNPATGRCKNIEVAPAAAVCAEGSERNPDTNRCRKIVAPKSTDCPAGSERNPDTNRCRKIVTPTPAKTCPAGQERNATTNRCRKIVAATTNSHFTGLTNAVTHNYKIIAGVLLLALAYGIYEYRNDLANLYAKLRGRAPGHEETMLE